MLRDSLTALSILISAFLIGTSIHPFLPNSPSTQNLSTETTTFPDTPTETPPASLEEVMQASENPTETLLIDARPLPFYEIGHIPNAISLPTSALNSNEYKKLFQQKRQAIVYCAHELCSDSKKVAQKISKDLETVKIFHEGWALWELMELPIQTPKTP